MKGIVTMMLIAIVLTVGATTFAASPSEQFAGCLIDNLNGKERKALARWIFFSIAAHPEIESYLSATQEDLDQTDEFVGKLITRLLTVDCPNELKSASDSDPLAIEKGFELVGQVAVQELMTNQVVTQALTNYLKYADQEKINSVLSGD